MIALNKLSRPRQSKLGNNIFVFARIERCVWKQGGYLGTCGLDTVERVEGVGVCGSRRYRSRRCRGAWPRIRRGEKAGRGEGVLLRYKSEIT